MLEWILAVVGVLCIAYGLLILSVGSGTMFFAVWFAIAAVFLALAAGVHFDAIDKVPRFAQWVGGGVLAAIIAASLTGTGLVASEFGAAGKAGLDYIVVLGAQVKDDGPSVVLRYRLDTAAEYLRSNPDTLCIVTGGQGRNEPITEAEGMRDYLESVGIDEKRIIMETRALNTQQNIAYSMELMESPEGSVGIVTNDFHVFRGVALARKQGLADVCGIAAPSDVLYLPNNVLRECFGIMKDFLLGNI